MASKARVLLASGGSRPVPSRHTSVASFLLLLLVVSGLGWAQENLTLRVAAEFAPSGGYAQIKVYADVPTLISRGALALDLDPRFFGPITSVSTFSASGDAMALAVVEGTHVSASVSSGLGGIGQLPSVPVFVVNAPVLASAMGSGFVSLSLPDYPTTWSGPGYSPAEAWVNESGKPYTTTLVSSRWSLSGPSDSVGTLSIKSVTPGAGMHASGTVLVIEGTSFDSATKLSVPGVGFSSVRVISPTQMEATLQTTSELTGARFHLEQQNNEQARVDFFVAAPSAVGLREGMHVVLPVNPGRSMAIGGTQSYWAGLLLNTTDTPAQIRVREFAFPTTPLPERRITLAPGAWAVVPASRTFNFLYLDSDVEIRMGYYRQQGAEWIGTAPSDGSVPKGNAALGLGASGFQPSQSSLTFVRESGLPVTDAPVSLQFGPTVGSAFEVRADTPGADWLEVVNAGVSQDSGYAVVNVNATKLVPGIYRGGIIGSSAGNSARTEVTLTVLQKPTIPPIANVTSLTFTTPAGVQSAPQRFIVSPGAPLIYTSEILPPVYLSFRDAQGLLPDQTYDLYAYGTAPGTYRSTITLTSSAGTTRIPVTTNITASAIVRPFISSIVNTASNLPGPLAPGELITIHGTGVGPQLVGLKLDAQGRIQTTASGARVEINGIAAPIVYGSVNQWNVIVPYEVEGIGVATVQVFASGLASEKWTLPVASSAPAIFTMGSTGVGQAAVLNQDNTVNSPTNRAPRGSVVQIYVTGGGAIAPEAVTGSVTPSGGAGRTRLPVKVQLLADAAVTYAGPAPGFASGVLQVNAVVPATYFGSSQTDLWIEVDGVRSQNGVWVWLR